MTGWRLVPPGFWLLAQESDSGGSARGDRAPPRSGYTRIFEMADLAYTLDLLNRAPHERYSSAYAEYKVHMDRSVGASAYRHLATTRGAARGPTQTSDSAVGDAADATIRVWVVLPALLRLEYVTGGSAESAIQRNGRWWARDRRDGDWSERRPSFGQAGLLMLDPAVLLGVWHWAAPETEVSGPSRRISAVPRVRLSSEPSIERVSRAFGLGANSWQLEVATNGTLARVDAQFNGLSYVTHEVTVADFDPTLPADLFTVQ